MDDKEVFAALAAALKPKEQMIAYFAQHLYQCTAEYEEEVGA